MVQMMGAINKTYFGGRQGVTCYSCHRGAYHPKVTPNPATLFSGVEEPDVELEPGGGATAGSDSGQVSGAWVARRGCPPSPASSPRAPVRPWAGSAKRPVEIYAKARGSARPRPYRQWRQTSVYDRRAGWIRSPCVRARTGAGDIIWTQPADADLTFRCRSSVRKVARGFSQLRIGTWRWYRGPAPEELATLISTPVRCARGALCQLRWGRIPSRIDYADYRSLWGECRSADRDLAGWEKRPTGWATCKPTPQWVPRVCCRVRPWREEMAAGCRKYRTGSA
jgi:hypothetical protein